MSIEIEKKFIIENVPFPLDSYNFVEITQGYISVEEGFSEVRVRAIDKKYILTIKSNKQNFRLEEECLLDISQGQRLLDFCKNRTIKKTRYFIPYNNLIIELDIFKEKLKGLKIAEVEFNSIYAIDNFKVPLWFGQDVTNDERYKNKNLAIYGL